MGPASRWVITYMPTRFVFAGVVHCGTNNGGCSGNATCTNIPEGHKCACNPGFTGDGNTCTRESAVVVCLVLQTLSPRVACAWLAGRWGQTTAACLQADSTSIAHRSPRPHVLCLQPWTRAPTTTEAAALMPPAHLPMAAGHAPARRASLATASLAQASGGSMRAC